MDKNITYQGRRDPRFVTIHRGGLLTQKCHQDLALWAASCAEHVLHLFEKDFPHDDRPNQAVKQTRAWANGEITMTQAREAAYAAHAAARECEPPASYAARAAGHAAAVAHMADHELGAAFYAIRAVRAASSTTTRDQAGQLENEWQHSILSEDILELVLSDQINRNKKFLNLFKTPPVLALQAQQSEDRPAD